VIRTNVQQDGVDVGQTPIRISVVVPFYNSQRHIESCIQALLAQAYPADLYEIIMIDNNSTDRSAAIVRKYSRINLVSEPKQGAYAARNRGIIASKGEIIAFTDPDCVPSSDWLKQIDLSMQDSAARIVVGTNESAIEAPMLRMLEDYENEKRSFIFSSRIKTIYYGYTNNMAVQKSLFSELGVFTEIRRGADVILVRRCVDLYSCDSVCYSRTIRVRHLEIDSAWSYFQKAFIYGNSIRGYGEIANARALNSRERFVVFRNTVKNREYSWTKSALLLGLLFTGLLHWVFGGIFGALIKSKATRSFF
jgi:glycosyltransferase involved in cell wall biosynthesis